MNSLPKSFIFSLMMHAMAIFFAVTLGSTIARRPKAILIDLTLVPPQGSASPGPQQKSEKNGPERPQAKAREKTERKSPNTAHEIKVEKPRQIEVRKIQVKPVAHEVKEIAPPAQPSDKREIAPHSAPANEAAQPANVTVKGGSGSGSIRSGPENAGGSGSGAGKGQGAAGHGTGFTAGQLRNHYLREQFDYIQKMIERNLAYPPKARRMGWTGRVVVSFTILENGRVEETKIVNSSGYNVLDDNVIETIKKVQPFPKPPVRAEIKIPITYRLDY
jgi:protein TonB